MRSWRRLVVAAALAALGACGSEEPKPPPSGGQAAPPGDSPSPPAAVARCGIAAEPLEFALPRIPGAQPNAFRDASGRAPCANGRTVAYELTDFDGDRQPDLVVESACDDTTVGPLAWRVHRNTGAGFAAEPARIALPLPRPPACAQVARIDVDGDLRPDLVTTSTCLDASVGTTRWLVNRNLGDGFADATDFALPESPVKGAFAGLASPSATASCPGAPAYRTLDVDGDLVLDLVVVSACDDALVGTTHWRVHRGTGTGFDPTGVPFELPKTPPPPRGLYAEPLGAEADCARSTLSRSYELADFDGDLAPDLLVTAQCSDPNVGSTRWLLYPNEHTRFAPEPRVVDLPVVPGAAGAFRSTAGDAQCEAQRPRFVLTDVTGDLASDLVMTRACNDATTGVSRWLLFPQRDGALVTTAEPFALPPVLGGTVDAPLGLSATAACDRGATKRPSFFAARLVENRFGLVVTSSCLDASVGHTRWLVHRAGCAEP